jgi:hypothetical protein
LDDATDDDEVRPSGQLLLDRKELSELGLEFDNPEGFGDGPMNWNSVLE